MNVVRAVPVPRRPFAAPRRAFSVSAAARHTDSYNDATVVPSYYVSRKEHQEQRRMPAGTPPSVSPATAAQRAAIRARKHEDHALMQDLSDGILGDSIQASTRRLVTKIPTEFTQADGRLVHPSGFVVPNSTSGPDHPRKDPYDQDEMQRAAQTAAVAERVLEESTLSELLRTPPPASSPRSTTSNAASRQEQQSLSTSLETRARLAKIPSEVRGLDGRVSHPSGFVPPTLLDDFHVHMGDSSAQPEDKHMHVRKRGEHWDRADADSLSDSASRTAQLPKVPSRVREAGSTVDFSPSRASVQSDTPASMAAPSRAKRELHTSALAREAPRIPGASVLGGR